MSQRIIMADDDYKELDDYVSSIGTRRFLLVCGTSLSKLKISRYFNDLNHRTGIEHIRFSDFQPNPLYESVEKGIKIFSQNNCDSIIAVGGGSAIDVAKCIKLYANIRHSENYLKEKPEPNRIRLLAIPTTAGAGSEATRYAVIYANGEKQSITDDSCIPSAVLFDPDFLNTLPVYQKKVTMMDAFCHALESFWSVNSTEESREYSKEAMQLLLDNMDAYLMHEESANENMLKAAYIAGKAINITQTTAGHAMSYKLTSLYGIAHGHAVALCISKLWPFMLNHPERCIDSRGKEFLAELYQQIADSMGCTDINEAVKRYQEILLKLELASPQIESESDYIKLNKSVNQNRLKNNPIWLDDKSIDIMYHSILGGY